MTPKVNPMAWLLFAALVILPGLLIWIDGGFDAIDAKAPQPASASSEETSPAAAS